MGGQVPLLVGSPSFFPPQTLFTTVPASSLGWCLQISPYPTGLKIFSGSLLRVLKTCFLYFSFFIHVK